MAQFTQKKEIVERGVVMVRGTAENSHGFTEDFSMKEARDKEETSNGIGNIVSVAYKNPRLEVSLTLSLKKASALKLGDLIGTDMTFTSVEDEEITFVCEDAEKTESSGAVAKFKISGVFYPEIPSKN